MSEVWKKWEGQVADHKYQLQQFLGSTDHSVVFLAEFHGPELRQAAVKFLSADVPNGEQLLAAWNDAAKLNHPNLIRIYGTGRCKLDEMDLLYVAMEYAEENLAQVLPQRALLVEETRDMLNAIVDVLVYLHGKSLAHGHIKPSNVLASGELLKLSSDTILPAGEIREMRRERSAYDAPELPDSPYTAASDVWSLGVTLVEAFTQQPAVLPFDEGADPVIPAAVREPFLEMARHTLRRDPKLRWNSAQVAKQLNPTAAASKAASAVAGASANAAASASVASLAAVAVAPASLPSPVPPLLVPLSKEPAIPLAKVAPAEASRPSQARPAAKTVPRKTMVLPSYVIPLCAGIFALIAVLLLPKVLRHRELSAANHANATPVSNANSAPFSSPSAFPKRAETPARLTAPKKASPSEVVKPAAPEHPAVTPPRPIAPAPAAAAAVLRTNERTPALTPKHSSDSPARGEVLDQVLPEPLAKALATIQGTVHIGVKVHVDAAGNVSEAALEAPGPSKYFANQALTAAERWVFSPPESNGRSVPSEWLIHFYFTPAGAKANASQTQP